ncbi:MAG: hypothetical protein WBJ62_04935 [Coriobacteriia bacterium]
MEVRITRRALVMRVSLAVVAAGAMLAGSYALLGSGDHFAIGGSDGKTDDGPATVSTVATGTVVTRIENQADLPSGVMVITVPLGTNFESPGSLYGTNAKKPVQLGPKNVRGMTQDAFSGQAGILLPDGEHVLYHFWETLASFPTEAPGDPVVPDGTHLNTPSIRLLDLASGDDELVLSGARSIAWRSDGMYAYTTGVDADYRYNVTYMRRVIVQQGLDGSPVTWTSDADQYTVQQWADGALFVWREALGGARDLLAFTGPDTFTRIVPEGHMFLCTSPDGTRILTQSGGFSGESEPFVLHEIEWRTGTEITSVSLDGVLDPATGEQVLPALNAAWEVDRIAVGLYPADLAMLSAAGDALTLQDVVTFSHPSLKAGAPQAIALDETGDRVFVIGREGSREVELERTAIITYDLESGECSRWIAPGTAVTKFVFNPSRPR